MPRCCAICGGSEQKTTAMQLFIGTRGSQLALVQAQQVAADLRQHHPDLAVQLEIIHTTGDRVLDVALTKVGDKGLFVKELEHALLEGRVQLAVHSCKDLPSLLPEGLGLAAFPPRANPHDALVLPLAAPALALPPNNPLDLLPAGAVVGTSSLRRAAQLQALRPDLHIETVRGNVNTRLSKLDRGQYAALILAAAGLERLGMGSRISALLPADLMLPAVAQGILAIEIRSDDHATAERLTVLDDPPARVAALAERALLRRLEGGCQVPIAAYAELLPNNDQFRLRGLVAALDGSTIIRGEQIGSITAPEQVGIALAEQLIAQGAHRLLAPDQA